MSKIEQIQIQVKRDKIPIFSDKIIVEGEVKYNKDLKDKEFFPSIPLGARMSFFLIPRRLARKRGTRVK